MMRISLRPQYRIDPAATLDIVKQGDALTINGEVFDFSALPDGATLPAQAVDCPFVLGEITRVDGDVRLTLILPCGLNPSPEVAYPAPLIDPPDGPLALPRDPDPEPEPEEATDGQH